MGKLLLLRHGQTDFNNGNIYFGTTDIPLNKIGINQCHLALDIIKNFNYDEIYSSCLSRSYDTAKIINHLGLEIKKIKELNEIDFGIFEGLKYEDVLTEYPKEIDILTKDWKNYNYISGESPKDFQKRVVGFVNSLDKDKNIIIVTHWGVINAILSWYLSKNLDNYWSFNIDNCGSCLIEFSNNFPIIKGLNIKNEFEF